MPVLMYMTVAPFLCQQLFCFAMKRNKSTIAAQQNVNLTCKMVKIKKSRISALHFDK